MLLEMLSNLKKKHYVDIIKKMKPAVCLRAIWIKESRGSES